MEHVGRAVAQLGPLHAATWLVECGGGADCRFLVHTVCAPIPPAAVHARGSSGPDRFRAQQAGVALECRCIHTHDLGTTHLIVGEVLVFHIRDELVLQEEGRLLVDSRKLDPLARLGGIDYAGLGHPLQAVVPRIED